MNNTDVYYKLSCLSHYENTAEKGYLIDYQIISNTFYIPYLYCQGAYGDNDACFIVELFYNEIKILECELNFELFDDMNDENELKKIKWMPVNIYDKYIEHYFENIEIKNCYIFEEKIIIIFNIDLRINGYMYEQIHGENTYDFEKDEIIDKYNVSHIK